MLYSNVITATAIILHIILQPIQLAIATIMQLNIGNGNRYICTYIITKFMNQDTVKN